MYQTNNVIKIFTDVFEIKRKQITNSHCSTRFILHVHVGEIYLSDSFFFFVKSESASIRDEELQGLRQQHALLKKMLEQQQQVHVKKRHKLVETFSHHKHTLCYYYLEDKQCKNHMIFLPLRVIKTSCKSLIPNLPNVSLFEGS